MGRPPADGHDPFDGELVPGLYDLAAAEPPYWCGLCVDVTLDVDENNGPSKYLVADSGIFSLATVDPTQGTGWLAGTCRTCTCGRSRLTRRAT